MATVRPLPLSDVVVLDLARVRSGPTAVRQLADWGADVLKIEAPSEATGGDSMGGGRNSPDFQNLQRNKRSMTLDLKSDTGKSIFWKLAEKADVIVENYRPDVKYRLGIDYEAVQAINPRIIYGSISGFGQSGPYSDRPGFDQVAQGMGGVMSVTGLPGQGPVRVGIPIADLSAGVFLAQGILLALYDRERTGVGQWVHTSLLEAQIAMLDFQAARWLIGHEVPPQAGNDHPTSIPTGVFPTADGYINIATSGNTMFRRLCEALELEHLIEQPDYKDGSDRSKNRAALNALIGEVTLRHTSTEWTDILNAAGVPTGPIYTIDQMFADPQVQHLAMTPEVTHDRLGTYPVVGQAVNLSAHPRPERMALPAPDAGQHTDEVLRSLGYDEASIIALREQGVV